MPEFTDYIRQRLENNGYRCKRQSAHDVFMSVDDKPIWICHLDAALEPEQIRRCFDYPGHVLFVVDEKLIPQEIKDRDSTPMWLRILHGLYMGRIYVWNGRHLFGLHFDYDTGDVSESSIIQPDELLLTETGTWLRGWTGIYRLARFYDRAWWIESAYSSRERRHENVNWNYERKTGSPPKQEPPKYTYGGSEQKSSARQEYEQARDRYQQAQRERERAQRTRYDSSGWSYDPADWPNGKPPGPPRKEAKRDFMREFAQAGSPSAIKALFRKLAKEFHPDLNPGVDTTEQMQEINRAYERWR